MCLLYYMMIQYYTTKHCLEIDRYYSCHLQKVVSADWVKREELAWIAGVDALYICITKLLFLGVVLQKLAA